MIITKGIRTVGVNWQCGSSSHRNRNRNRSNCGQISLFNILIIKNKNLGLIFESILFKGCCLFEARVH
jgi:hypothetical protein